MSSKAYPTMASRIRALRERLGFSQADLAARLPGVKQQSIDQVERGLVSRPRFLPELAEALGTSVQWLLTGEGEEKPQRSAMAPMEVDVALLRDVYTAVETVLAQQKLSLPAAHRAQLVGALYELMRSEENRNADKLSQAAANIVSYDQLLRQGRAQ